MKFVLIVIIALFSYRTSLHAQISGIVQDVKSQPVSYANVSLYSLPDSLFLLGTTTDESGYFSFYESLPTSHVFAKVSCIGYATKIINPIGKNEKVLLQANSVSLGDVVVSAKRTIFKNRGTDIIADVQNSVLKDFGFADDIIDKLPMVSGINGNYSIFGKGNAVVYIGRRKVSDPSELSRITSNDISTIEVISNPGPEYDADTHAVIKINLKRQDNDGIGGMFAARDGQGRRNFDYEQAQITYNTSKINAFAIFSNSSSRYSTDQENSENVQTNNNVWTISSSMPKWKSNYYVHTVSGGFSVFLNKNNTLGGQVTYQKDTERYGGNSMNQIYRDGLLYEDLSSDIFSKSKYSQWQSNIYYESHIGEKISLNLNGDYFSRKSSDNKNNEEVGELTTSHKVLTQNKSTYDIMAGLLVLEYNANKCINLKIGSNISYVKDQKTYNGFDNTSVETSSSLTSKENKIAFFAEGDFSLGKLSANVGTRYEFFKMSYFDNQNHSYLVDRNYERFYPYASLELPLNHVKMGVSLSTKVMRPSYYELRNSQEYFNRYETEAGNPLLLPQYTTDLSYSIQYKQFRFSMAYQWIKDYIMTNNIIDSEDVLHFLSQPQNKSHYSAFNSYISYNKTIGVWESYIDLNIIKTFFNIYNSDGKLANGKNPYAELSFNNYFNLRKNWMPYLLLKYNNTGYMREYKIREGLVLGLGVTKSFFNKALYARLSINNLFATKEKEVRYSSNYIFDKTRYKDSRNISLFLRYTFNNKKRYKGQNAAEEEINRL